MSRASRTGEPGKLVGVRAAPSERERWEASAKYAGASDLSAWLRQAADELADAGKDRRRGWMRSGARLAPGKARRNGR